MIVRCTPRQLCLSFTWFAAKSSGYISPRLFTCLAMWLGHLSQVSLQTCSEEDLPSSSLLSCFFCQVLLLSSPLPSLSSTYSAGSPEHLPYLFTLLRTHTA